MHDRELLRSGFFSNVPEAVLRKEKCILVWNEDAKPARFGVKQKNGDFVYATPMADLINNWLQDKQQGEVEQKALVGGAIKPKSREPERKQQEQMNARQARQNVSVEAQLSLVEEIEGPEATSDGVNEDNDPSLFNALASSRSSSVYSASRNVSYFEFCVLQRQMEHLEKEMMTVRDGVGTLIEQIAELSKHIHKVPFPEDDETKNQQQQQIEGQVTQNAQGRQDEVKANVATTARKPNNGIGASSFVHFDQSEEDRSPPLMIPSRSSSAPGNKSPRPRVEPPSNPFAVKPLGKRKSAHSRLEEPENPKKKQKTAE